MRHGPNGKKCELWLRLRALIQHRLRKLDNQSSRVLLLPTQIPLCGKLTLQDETQRVPKRGLGSRSMKRKRIPLLFFFVLLFFYGCATPQKAIYLAPSFEQKNVDLITILPIVDARAQSWFEIKESDLQQIVYPAAEGVLIEKGYSVEYSEDVAGIHCLKFGRTSKLESECLRTVGPPNSRWVLVLFLNDFRMRTAYGGAVSTKMSGILIDRKEGLMLWRDLEYTGLSQRELVGKNMDTFLARDVIQNCSLKLIGSLPKKRAHPKGS